MAFPAVATTATSVTTPGNTSHTVNLPASIVSGDLLLLFFRVLGGEAATWPAGYTELFDAGAERLACAFRRADGTEGASITVTTVNAARSVHRTYRITGHHATSDPEVGTLAEGSSLNPNPPTLDPAGWGAEDTLWFAVCSYHTFDTRTLSAFPASYTNTFDDQESTDGPGLGSCRRELNAASEDPGTFTISGTGTPGWSANTIAIRPTAPKLLALLGVG